MATQLNKSYGAQIAKDLNKLSAHLLKHEAVCEQRYDMICARLKRLERVLMSAAGAIILLLATLVLRA